MEDFKINSRYLSPCSQFRDFITYMKAAFDRADLT